MVYICIDHVVKFPTLVVRETNEFEDADFFFKFRLHYCVFPHTLLNLAFIESPLLWHNCSWRCIWFEKLTLSVKF